LHVAVQATEVRFTRRREVREKSLLELTFFVFIAPSRE